ncbi:hypothetical protein M9194_17815 [Vibrio sp. S4M6]|uniref:methyltransferase n=1 Tax=Vibrio sinus TaxID=2946865 RepID=UPI00202A08D5|nr:methyltransferase [Vibrio sinus]MCL9783290.1 hypothetical protein [Vibrio sinus]
MMTIKEILFGYYGTQCVATVVELKIADLIESGVTHIDDLAQKTSSRSGKLYRIMRFLTAKGVFTEHPGQKFSLNKESKQLLSSHPENIQDFIKLHASYFYQGAGKIYESMSTDVTPFELEFGSIAGQYFRDNDVAGEIYNSAMKENSELYGRLITELYDFSSYKNIIDIGGGIGSLIVNILLKYQSANGINFDIPNLQQRSEEYIGLSEVSHRCKYVSGDFYESIPQGGDIYLMKAILHGKTQEEAATLLEKCRQTMVSAKAKLLVIERAIINNSAHYVEACTNDINMLNVTAGKVRTLAEFESLYDICGLNLHQIIPITDSVCLMELSA